MLVPWEFLGDIFPHLLPPSGTSMAPYLKLKGSRYHVRLRVPGDVRWAFSGKAEVWKATGTGDRREAAIKAHAHAATFKAEVERARGNMPATRSADDPLLRLAMEWRGNLIPLEAPADPDDLGAQAALSAAQDAAIEVAEKLPGGPQQALFVAVALHGRTPLATLVDAWGEQRRRDVKAKTADMDLAAVRRFVRAFPLAAHANKSAVVQWLEKQREERREEPLDAGTLGREVTGLRQFWRWLGQRGVYDTDKTGDPFAGLSFKPRGGARRRKEKREPFTAAEVAALYAEAVEDKDDDLAKAIAIAAYTGARLEEITSFEAPANKWLDVKDAKTAAGIRRIPVAARLTKLVVFPKAGPVFPDLGANQYGDRGGAIGKRFGRLKTRMGHSELKVFHSIRRTVARQLEGAGVLQNVVQDLLGHEKPGESFGRYSGRGGAEPLFRAAISKLKYPKPL